MKKVCSKCKETKEDAEFYKNKRKKDGLEYSCKECKSIYDKTKSQLKYIMNKDRIKLAAKIWAKNHKEQKRNNDKNWAINNKEKVIASTNKFRMKNPESQKRRNLKKYGITLEQYNQLFVDQNGVCAICEQKQMVGSSLYVDHNHSTGKVRGLLCHKCNFGLGQFNDSEDILLKATNYLNRYGR